MANPTVEIKRYIGGGRLYFTPYVDGAYGIEVEIGEVKDFSLSITPSTVEAIAQDDGEQVEVEDVVMKVVTELSFSTQNLNKENRTMAYMGVQTTETFDIGDTLPDGTVATESTTIDKITGLENVNLRGKLRCVSAPINNSAEYPVLVVYMGSIRPKSSVGYILTDFAKLDFSGKVIKTDNGWFDEYLLPVA